MASNTLNMMRQSFKMLADTGCFDRVSEKVRILSADAGKLTAELTVEKEHTNRGGTLHGGLTATLVDQLSTLSMFSFAENSEFVAGVSVDLSVKYLNPASIGDVLLIEASTLKRGRQVAFLNVDFTNKSTGKLVARGSHVKYMPNPSSKL